MEQLDVFIKELLHLDDVRGNRLLDVGDLSGKAGASAAKAYRLFSHDGQNCNAMLQVIASRRGKPSNKTVLNNSALVKSAVENPLTEKWDWTDLAGGRDVKALDKFISEVYNALDLKGNNPLFLGVGCLSWSVAAGDEIKKVNSPLLIFPIRFVRGTNTSPVEIEFVDDDAYFNPCLIGRMEGEYPEQIAANFPHPNGIGASFDEAIDLVKLGDGTEYMNKVAEYVRSLCPADGEATVSFDKDVITVAQYNHSDICMYYDVRRNKQKIYAHPLVMRIFGGDISSAAADEQAEELPTRPILPIDSVQDKIISKVAAGQSLIVKGPPGTGKTLTIANMIATLLARGKSVIVASEKLSALAEVYAKLPEDLRKFVMLLDYETEKQAAAVNPAQVRAEFKRLIKNKKEYVYDSANDMRGARADRQKAEAMIELAAYCNDVFGNDVAFGSYYDALDNYFKGADLPVVAFTDSGTAAAISREDYNRLLLAVKECAAHYAHLSADGDIALSPWLGVTEKTDTERAIKALCDIVADMSEISDSVKTEERDLDCTYGDMHDGALTTSLSAADIRKILTKLSGRDGELLEMLTDKYELAKEKANTDKFVFKNGVQDESFMRVADIKYADVKLSTVNAVANNSDLFLDGNRLSEQAAAKFAEVINNIADIKRERDGLAADVMFVFDKAELNDDKLLKACASIIPYAQKQSIGLFDFKAKSAEKKLRAVCSRADITLKELAHAATAYARINECDGKLSGLLSVLSHVVGRDALTKEQADCIFTVADLSKALGLGLQAFVSHCVETAQAIAAVSDYIVAPDDYTVSELVSAVEFMYAKTALDTGLGVLCEKCEISVWENALGLAQSISALIRISRSSAYKGDVDGVINFVSRMQSKGSAFASKIAAVVNKLKDFGDKYFVNAYTRAPWFVTPKNTKTFIAQANDRSMLHAALSYGVAAHSGLLSAFFDEIERGEIKVAPDRFTELFVHSYLGLVIDHKLSALGLRRNGLCKNAELALKSFTEAENEIYACNVKRTENLCFARLNADDDDFDFLSVDKGKALSLRALFKAHGEAIVKLKRCFIMSPSTASVLFRGDAYENFDVAIVDEASQMEPVDMLPVLYRSKQCVLVGDEFQMPPLTHFKTKNRKRISDPDSELTLDTDISALSLALGNLAFDAEELVCHYRSNTETLIEFSQREFYPYMRTFPATVPYTPDLGFTDVLTADGYCEDGVNPIEAQAVIAALHEHFTKYYDKSKGTLKMSVGVVTFGEAQLKHVLSLVRADKKLFDCIETAWRNFDDVPDKLVFFRTIESVQGQETDHLILSLTYGRDKNKNIKLAFGELNRDATGKNIFNVAVTRAKSRVTVIHTLTAQQMLGNPRIAFIQSYLSSVERYALVGRSQFVSSAPEKGGSFVAAVAEYIMSCGVDSSRIVTNYGVTDGSVRIPVAVLSKDLQRAELGVWCEYPVLKKYDFYDYNARYVASLRSRGWALHKVYCHDWYDNEKAEKAALKAAVQKHVTK